MSDIGPGDYVQCIDASTPLGSWDTDEFIFEGAYYWVSDVFVNEKNYPVLLVGFERTVSSKIVGYRQGYGVYRFRKIEGGGDRLDVRAPEKALA